MQYLLVEENEQFLKAEHILWQDETEMLIAHEKTFRKFLLKTKFSYQVELAKGTFRWKEEKLYRSIETIDEIIESLASVSIAVKKLRDAKENLISKEK